MDWKNFAQKIKGKVKLRFLLWITGGFTFILVSGFLYYAGPQIFQHAKFLAHISKDNDWSVSKVFQVYGQALISVQEKMESLQKAEEQSSKLTLENANLRLKLESAQFECHSREAAVVTKSYEMKLNSETGSKIGRTLATINYKPPGHLLPLQLYTLGISYFKAREDEKAAVIFTFMTGMDDNEAFKTPKNFLLTGISWYRLSNYQLADFYLDKVLSVQESPDNIQYQAQARLWKAMVSERLNKHLKSQHWLRELVDHHPHSKEAGWVNSGNAEEANRATASD